MNAWTAYQHRVSGNSRQAVLQHEQDWLARKLPSYLSYHIASVNGVEQELAIISTDNLEVKTVCSMPRETFECGSTIFWADNYWIVTALDADREVYTRGQMTQCNYLLRWIAEDGRIIERNCIVTDGTKYLTGETVSSYNENGMAVGDTRVALTLPRDEYTVKLNRTYRFLIDDYDSGDVLAYRIGKPFKIGGVYNGHGAMTFMMTEVNTEEDDNLELHIADYYKYFPRDGEAAPDGHATERPTTAPDGKKVWL